MQRPHGKKADKDRCERIADVENELLNEIRVENDDARQKSEQPHNAGDEHLEQRLRVE